MYEVYKITCAMSDKIYIGCTKSGLARRFQQHLTDAYRSKNTALGDAIRLHGPSAFFIESVWSGETREEAHLVEIQMIADLGCRIPNGYNITPGGTGVRKNRRVYVKTGPRGPHTDATKEKIRQAKLGKPRSEETKQKLRLANLGKKRSPESIEKSRVAALGRTHSPETKAKIGSSQKGRVLSKEQCLQMSVTRKGRARDPEVIKRQILTWQLKNMVKSLEYSYGLRTKT